MQAVDKRSNQDISYEDLNLNDPKVIDSLTLDKKQYRKGLVQFLFFTVTAILIFFVPFNINGKSGQILFGVIYNGIINLLGNFGLWLVTFILLSNGIVSFYGKYWAKEGTKLYDYYKGDSIIHPILYLLGGIFAVMFSLSTTMGLNMPEIIVGPKTGEMVIPPVVLGVAWIIPVGAFFMPFLTEYGCIDFFGVLLEPLMRPLFKIPGKAAVDATASFVGSTSMAIIMTSRLYKSNTYTKREACLIATSFSAVSVGYAVLVTETAGLADHFLETYFSSFILAFIVAAIVGRIRPLSRKEDVYYNGKIQTEEERKIGTKFEAPNKMLKKGVDRAVKRAYTSGKLLPIVKDSLVEGIIIVPKVITLLCSIGIIGMILARYTPFFKIIGYIFLPLIKLLQVPDALEVAAAIPAGVTEMFLPVLTIADRVDIIAIGARYFITAVSMVQIIFLAESVVVVMTTGIPLKFRELMIIFLERTFIAMPFAALFMHILF
ncbi:YjiH family protein [Schnuerera sp. xch1]|uniref:YjiH family protein n=1 Tax=Schnuerera sp. xch1 TaxID=2874283 RepID=UPI001CBC223F|nr:YjiH family protein [Schnuerera sp. xch1]MBZ2174840.1 YjiH family protein [Schnuerera sp. xch1]